MEYTRRICEELIDKLDQIKESVDVIAERIKDAKSVDTLLRTPWGVTTLDACVMRLQVIGELVRAIDTQTKGELFVNFSLIPWRKVIGLRNIISHEYANIDYNMIWEVFTLHLPPLRQEVIKIRNFLEKINGGL